MRTPKQDERIYRITDSDDPRCPYSLIDPTDTVVRVAERPSILADLAFDIFGATEVRHEECLIRAGERARS